FLISFGISSYQPGGDVPPVVMAVIAISIPIWRNCCIECVIVSEDAEAVNRECWRQQTFASRWASSAGQMFIAVAMNQEARFPMKLFHYGFTGRFRGRVRLVPGYRPSRFKALRRGSLGI